jgi:carotenoid 1,2-hydratase
MTERGAHSVTRSAEHFQVGPSSLTWNEHGLTIDINERCAPFPFPLRGKIKLKTDFLYDAPVQLDAAGKHFWQAVAPQMRVAAEFENPKLKWQGTAYHDMNWGDEPLENGFKKWTWSRAMSDQGTEVIYDVDRRDDTKKIFGNRFHNGQVTDSPVPPLQQMPKGLWGMPRDVHSETPPQLIAKLEDTPFYTRSHVRIALDGKPCDAFHESLSLDHFVKPSTQLMLPFRMPRVGTSSVTS